MKSKIFKWVITAMSLFIFFCAEAQNAKHHVIFQLASNDTLVHKGLMKQLKNVMEGMESVEIEVVCHSNGISLLMKEKTKFAAELQAFKDKGVVFSACQNTMKERNIKPEEIVPLAAYVPSGLVEIIKKQEADWSYVKAGF